MSSWKAIPAHIVAGVLKDYQPPRLMGVEGVAAKWGVSAPDALYILWRHHVPIRTARGGHFPPPVSVPLVLPANLPQPLIAANAAAEQIAADPAEPAGKRRTFLAKEVVIITGRPLAAVYNDIYTGKVADGRPSPRKVADLPDPRGGS